MNHKIKQLIEEQSQSLNSEVLSKLNQARQKALGSHLKKPAFFTAWFIPTTAVAALAIYFLMPFMRIQDEGGITIPEQQLVISEMELIEQIDLVENLEFYEWLSLEEETSSI